MSTSNDDLRTLLLDFRQSVSNDFAVVNQRLDVHDRRFDRLEDRMTGLEGQIIGLEGRMVGLEGRMTGLEGRMTGLEDRMTGLENQMLEFQDETRTRFRTMEGAIMNAMRDLHRGIDARLRRLQDN